MTKDKQNGINTALKLIGDRFVENEKELKDLKKALRIVYEGQRDIVRDLGGHIREEKINEHDWLNTYLNEE